MPNWTAGDSRGEETRGWRRQLRQFLPGASFITLHYIYFIGTCLFASLVFYGSSTPPRSVRYIDAIFLVVSAMTGAGLNTVNLSQLSTFQQFILFLLIMMGSAIFVSSAIIQIRKNAFKAKMRELAEPRHGHASALPDTEQPFDRSMSGGVVENQSHRHYRPTLNLTDNTNQRRYGPMNSETVTGDGTYDIPAHPWHSGPQLEGQEAVSKRAVGNAGKKRSDEQDEQQSKLGKYIQTANGYLGRNSQVHSLTAKERRELGGIEYDALRILSYLVPIYFVLFQLFGALGCGLWMHVNQPTIDKDLNPFWRGAFLAVSAFNNSGMALLDANVTVLQRSYYMLMTLSLLIVAGKTGFPPFLRLIVWIMKCCMPDQPRWCKAGLTLRFILDHPRRVYTNLFPADATWWLVASLVVLNGIDWLAFEVLNIGNPVVEAIPPRFRALDGLFQAFAIRSGGFHVVNLSMLYPGTLVMYIIMMYLNAFPVTMALRNTNVYEEQSLGIFPGDEMPSVVDASDDTAPRKDNKRNTSSTQNGPLETDITQPARSAWLRRDFVRLQLISQLGHDLWWLALAVFFITIIETGQYIRDPVTFSVLNTIFEVVSGYGTVGVTTGVPWDNYSLCGAWHTGSKLILCAVMLRGRHRELPVNIDRAVMLPGQTQWRADQEDGRIGLERGSKSSTASLVHHTTLHSPDSATSSNFV